MFGMISCGNAWWLLKRESPLAEKAVAVSAPFSWSTKGRTQPTVLAAVLWVVRQAQQELAQRPPLVDSGPQSSAGGQDVGGAGGSEDSEDEGGNGEEGSDGDDKNGDYEPSEEERQVKPRVQSTPSDVPEGALHLEKRPPIGSGWSGNVCAGKIRGRPAAIKLARSDDERGQALLTEAENYLKLRKLWGTYVPRMLSHGTTCNGQMVFLATELLPGKSLDDVPKGECSPEVSRKAKEALQAVHSAGLLHRDVDSRNFIVVDRGGASKEGGDACPDVFIFDFGFSQPVRSQEECVKEMRQLERFL